MTLHQDSEKEEKALNKFCGCSQFTVVFLDILDLKLTDVQFDPPLHPQCGSLYRNHRHQSQQLELVRLPL